uniref:hypothetical protein n=1 Tax=Flavobacterium sp. TaxID=239 RepID=UPI00404A9795
MKDTFLRILTIGALLILSFYINKAESNTEILFSFIKWLFVYISILMMLSIFNKYKAIKLIQSILWLPIEIILIFAPLFFSLNGIFMAYIIALCLSILLFILIPLYFFELKMQQSAMIYIILTSTSIIISTIGNKIIEFWHYVNNKTEKEKHLKLSLSILNQKKSRYLIFIIYFVLLIIFNFASFNNTPVFNNEKLTATILQSFATFIAFDRLYTNWNSLK